MKKLFVVAASALALLGMASCGNTTAKEDKNADAEVVKTAYTGILPGADCDGIVYALQLGDGKYDMLETYISVDTASNAGVSQILSVKSQGITEAVENDGKSYLKLVPSGSESAAGDILFLQSSDSTLTMVSSDFELPALPANYTLKLVK